MENMYLTDKSKESLKSETWQDLREVTKEEIIKEYLKAEYSDENKQHDFEVAGTLYRFIKRGEIITFYDVFGNTLFDVSNEQLKSDYESMLRQEIQTCAILERINGTDLPCSGGLGIKCGLCDRLAVDQPMEEVKDESAEEVVENTKKEDEDSEISAPVEEAPADKSGNDGEVFGGIEDAVAKLQTELNKASDKSFADPVINHLIERARESGSLAKDILQTHKTWDKCFKYIRDQARKAIKGSCGAVRDSVVYEWAEDYYHLDDKAAEEKKANEAAERKKKEEDRKRKENEKVKKEKKPSDKKAAAPNTEQKEAPTSALEAKAQHKSKKNEMDGQMDLFSLMGL